MDESRGGGVTAGVGRLVGSDRAGEVKENCHEMTSERKLLSPSLFFLSLQTCLCKGPAAGLICG